MTRVRGQASLAIALSLTGCAAPTLLQPGTPAAVTQQKLGPLDTLEQCARLEVGDRLDYRFESSAPVAFDIHYREGNALVTPISNDPTTGESNIFPALVAGDYCMSWQARHGEAQLSYRAQVRPPLK
ncbi:MAG TPA: hypothetical protein VMV45_14450 [Casimicrobiaceae bacterium]|nr:hypothetical protein [Casimicrobiaceae bacterium]